MKEKILEILKDEHYVPLTIDAISTILNASNESVEKVLRELENEYIIRETKKHKFDLLERYNMYIGIIDVKEQGFGFIHSEEKLEDFYVAKNNVCGAYNKDKVLFKVINDDNTMGFRKEAAVLKVITRNMQKCIGTIIKNKRNNLCFKNNDSTSPINFQITDFGIAVATDVVEITIDEFVTNNLVKAHVTKIIGNIHDARIDIKAVACKYGFENEFPEDVINEVANKFVDIEKEKARRKNVRKSIITIDGDSAKDLDDAVCVEKLSDGNYFLGVYIADVSYYVLQDSKLDQEALNRGTSVYLADSVIPMLPHKLSNDWCSLNEQETKLVIACEMIIDKDGRLLNQDIFEATIETRHRMTYNNINKMLDGKDLSIITKYQDIYDEVLLMAELSEILRKRRMTRGSLDFDIPESEIICDDKGEVIDVRLRTRGQGEKLIEEFMLTANETVATTISHLNLPFIYRVHDEPNQLKLARFLDLCHNFGYEINSKRNKTDLKTLQNLLSKLTEEDKILASLLLKSMAKAKYSETNIGHYGLASKCYTHFTSPIRRYPDLLCHRLIRQYLFENDVSLDTQNTNLQMISKIATWTSKKERDAIECEYEVEDMKTAEFMEKYIGHTFPATITSITNFGMFCTLDNNIEGLIHVSTMNGYYTYNDKKMIMRSDKKTYRLGEKIQVKVKSADKQLRLIDFVLIDENNYQKKKAKR